MSGKTIYIEGLPKWEWYIEEKEIEKLIKFLDKIAFKKKEKEE